MKKTFRSVPTFSLLSVYTGEPWAAKHTDGTWVRSVLIACAKRNGYVAEDFNPCSQNEVKSMED